MAPGDCLLETLEKYGEQAREVRLTLLHNGPLVRDDMSRAKVGRYQPCPALRKKDVGARTRRGSASLGLHRQSLPPLSFSGQETERQNKEDLKGPKRKSLTLMEEAWEWLESLGKGKVYSTARDKESSKKTDRRNRSSLGVSLTVDEGNSGRSSRSKVRGQKSLTSDLDHQTSCCMGSQTRGKESKRSEGALSGSGNAATIDEKSGLRETLMRQLSRLQDLQVQIANTDRLILELEDKQGVRKAEREARQRAVDEETEQIQFWENELKAEEGYEKDLQRQFLEMRENAAGCKAKLEEYRRKMQGLDFFAAQEHSEGGASAAAETSTVPSEDLNQQRSDPDGDSRKFPPREVLNPPHARVPASQIKERRPTGPTELREWWTRWAQAQIPKSQSQNAATHRSELTIYLSGTKSQTLS